MCQQYQQASHDAAHGNDVLGTATAAHGQWARARFKPRPGGAEPAEAAMLGTRLQRAAILHLQQPAATPTREVGPGRQGRLPQLRRRVYENDGTERSPRPREVQAAPKLIGGDSGLTTALPRRRDSIPRPLLHDAYTPTDIRSLRGKICQETDIWDPVEVGAIRCVLFLLGPFTFFFFFFLHPMVFSSSPFGFAGRHGWTLREQYIFG